MLVPTFILCCIVTSVKQVTRIYKVFLKLWYGLYEIIILFLSYTVINILVVKGWKEDLKYVCSSHSILSPIFPCPFNVFSCWVQFCLLPFLRFFLGPFTWSLLAILWAILSSAYLFIPRWLLLPFQFPYEFNFVWIIGNVKWFAFRENWEIGGFFEMAVG